MALRSRGKKMSSIDLRENERRILVALKELGGKTTIERIVEATGLAYAAVMRAALSLEDKKLVRINEKKLTRFSLNDEGEKYAEKGLPERRLAEILMSMGGEASISDVFKAASIDNETATIALGWLIRKGWAEMKTGERKLKILREPEIGSDEKLLAMLKVAGTLILEDLDNDLKEAFKILKSRKILIVGEGSVREVELTDDGLKLLRKSIEVVEEVTQLTPELIVTGKWREKRILKYNIKAPAPRVWPGKKHPYLRFLDEVREKLVALGFKEMNGPIVEVSFFNCDGLYMPQDHPAREIHDMYLIKDPEYGDLSPYMKFLEQVKETHENGWKTGSRGWGYKFSLLMAARLILRSHTTAVSVRTLISDDLEIPGKYFAIARCYRPELMDKTHLSEFNQVEGIVVGEDLTLRDLLGILERFAIDIAGADKVRFRPDYFPFTEPSVELSAYKEGYGWMEFGGSGIFRPEVTLPLGIDVPVLAWGLGVDRLFMMRAGINDIRYLFTHNLDWLRRREMI
ncbi:MAG: phenylalanine--tRNA ligase subunit alpha [Candidatus Bathyarchaeota archaeon]|nr:phenylalanine--tRNA ligase subunit alpha [Candidatus Bathyarchaeota archaeon]